MCIKFLWRLINVIDCSSVRQNAVQISLVRTSPDFPEVLLVFVEIVPDKVVLDHKKSYLVSYENFIFFRFLAKIGNKWKNHKKGTF